MKNAKRWLAVILAVTLLGSNAVYQLGTTLSANETEAVTESQQDESENAVAEQAEKQQEDTGKATVQEVTPQEDKSDASAQESKPVQEEQQTKETQTESQTPAVVEAPQAEQTQEAAPANAGQSEAEAQAETPVAQTYDVKINKPDLDGGQIKVWGTDGIQTDVTSYDGNNQYVKEVTEGEDFNFQITRNDGFEIENVTVNGAQIAPESTDGNVSTYKLSGVAEEKAITITYNKVETPVEDEQTPDGTAGDEAEEAEQNVIALQAAPNGRSSITIYGPDSVYIDGNITLTATVKNAEGTVEWSSSDPTVATVDQNGQVTGVKKGTVTIYAAIGTALLASKQITVKRDESNGYYVYLYTKVTGDTSGLVLNKDGWYTIGKLWVSGIDNPKNYSKGRYSKSGKNWENVMTALENLNSNFERYGSNTTIEMSSIKWDTFGLLVENGATNYVGAGNQWHLDGMSEVSNSGSVTINYYEKGTTNKLAESQTVTAEAGTVINGANYKKTITGYTYTSANPS